MSSWSLYDTETWQLQLQNPPLPILQMQLFIYSCIFNKFSDRSLGSEIPELEIMTDQPTNQPTDQQTDKRGYTSNKDILEKWCFHFFRFPILLKQFLLIAYRNNKSWIFRCESIPITLSSYMIHSMAAHLSSHNRKMIMHVFWTCWLTAE